MFTDASTTSIRARDVTDKPRYSAVLEDRLVFIFRRAGGGRKNEIPASPKADKADTGVSIRPQGQTTT